jgi:hypothetical protein
MIFHTRTPGIRIVAGAILVLTATACTSPQQRAVAAHCEIEAQNSWPQKLTTQQVMRSVQVGERIVGNKNTCRTEVRETSDKKGASVTIRETVCKDEPIREPVYAQRSVTERVDLNEATRAQHVRACTADALARGMFANLR